MHAKKIDKIATGVLYAIAGIIVTILASLILYILVRGLPHVSWTFLTSKSSSYQAGGGIGIQLYNSFFLLVITLIISFPLSLGDLVQVFLRSNQELSTLEIVTSLRKKKMASMLLAW